MQPQDLSQRFMELDALLTEYQQYWQLQAFSYLDLPWRLQNPGLCAWLEALTQAQLMEYAADNTLLIEGLRPFLPKIERIEQLSQFSALDEVRPSAESQAIPARLSSHIKGRKWQQILAFESATASSNTGSVIEWCAGKGHLGRLLAFKQQIPVTSVEWLPELCKHGQHLAEASQLPIRFFQANVLSGEANALLSEHHSAVALHACGELHLHLLRQGAKAGLKHLSIAPCCYHLIPQPLYQPLSSQGQQSTLQLGHQDLKFPLQETVVAGARVQRLRQIELSWRLGFDCLQRVIRGNDDYLPVPSIAKKLLSGSFGDFCRWAAAEKQLMLPTDCCFEQYLQQGINRLSLLAKIELVQQPFRAAVEAWLILERALFLLQEGYELELGTFCERHLTPRNIMIRAKRVVK